MCTWSGRTLPELSLEMWSTAHTRGWSTVCWRCGFAEMCLAARDGLTTIPTPQNIARHGFVGGKGWLDSALQLYISPWGELRRLPTAVAFRSVGFGKKPLRPAWFSWLFFGWQAEYSRVLILVPESLGTAVVCGSLAEINLWFQYFDEKRCRFFLKKGRRRKSIPRWFQAGDLSIEFFGRFENEPNKPSSANWRHVRVLTKRITSNGQLAGGKPRNIASLDLLSRSAKALTTSNCYPGTSWGWESHFHASKLDPIGYANSSGLCQRVRRQQRNSADRS